MIQIIRARKHIGLGAFLTANRIHAAAHHRHDQAGHDQTDHQCETDLDDDIQHRRRPIHRVAIFIALELVVQLIKVVIETIIKTIIGQLIGDLIEELIHAIIGQCLDRVTAGGERIIPVLHGKDE